MPSLRQYALLAIAVTTAFVIAAEATVAAAAVTDAAVAGIDAADMANMGCNKTLHCAIQHVYCIKHMQVCDGKGDYAVSRSDPRQ